MKKEVLGEFVSINPAVGDMVMGDLAIDNPGEAFKNLPWRFEIGKNSKKSLFLTEIQQIDNCGG